MEEECDGDMHHDGICCLMALCQGDDGDGVYKVPCACHLGDGFHKILDLNNSKQDERERVSDLTTCNIAWVWAAHL